MITVGWCLVYLHVKADLDRDILWSWNLQKNEWAMKNVEFFTVEHPITSSSIAAVELWRLQWRCQAAQDITEEWIMIPTLKCRIISASPEVLFDSWNITTITTTASLAYRHLHATALTYTRLRDRTSWITSFTSTWPSRKMSVYIATLLAVGCHGQIRTILITTLYWNEPLSQTWSPTCLHHTCTAVVVWPDN